MKTKKINVLKTLTLSAVLLFASCQKENIDESTNANSSSTTGKTIEKYFQGDLVTVEDIGNGLRDNRMQ